MPLPIDSAIRRRQEFFTQPIQRKIEIPPPESSFWYWNPNRVGIKFAPDWFREKLHEIDKDLEVTWSSYHERWMVWVKQPRLISKLCSGWLLMFPVRDLDGSYLPLDERIFARIYSASVH